MSGLPLKPSLLLLALALFSPSALCDQELVPRGGCPADKPWAITLTGNADYECSVSGPGWSTGCGKGQTVCAAAIDDLATGGGAIHLFAPKADRSKPGTLIECTFTTPKTSREKSAASNCDISLVDGYNFDVMCTGDLTLGYRPGEVPGVTKAACVDDGKSKYWESAGVCENKPGKAIHDKSQAPAFFQKFPAHKGVYVAAYQKVGIPTFQPGATGGHITCEVNGGLKAGYKPRDLNEEESAEEEIVERNVVDTSTAEASLVVERSAGHTHILRHAQRARGHKRGLAHVIGASS